MILIYEISTNKMFKMKNAKKRKRNEMKFFFFVSFYNRVIQGLTDYNVKCVHFLAEFLLALVNWSK